MISRRAFTGLMASSVAFGSSVWAQSPQAKTVFFASVGPVLTLYDIDAGGAVLTARGSVTLPANVQYAWPHPSRRYFYVTSSNGQPGGGDAPKGDVHSLNAFTLDPTTGRLSPHGEARALPSRPIHNSVDRTGQFVLTAFNDPSSVTVHRLNVDGTLGEMVNQPTRLDTGIYAHQVLASPSNRSVIVIARGNNATASKAEDPGSIHVFGFNSGILSPLQTVRPGTGLGFGPRHLDFHPIKPWVYVSIERQNQIYLYDLQPDGKLSTTPRFVKSSLLDSRNVRPSQGAGTIHVHPNGRFVYQTNRNAGVVDYQGQKVFGGGENNVAVWSINQETGEPTFVEAVEGHGIQLRTFGVHPSGQLLVAASIQPLPVRNGERIEILSAGLSVYRIDENTGRLTFQRKYDVDTARGTQFWSGMVTLA
jgi:6-phosphogluconolactonase (cycloisomerase 2 family)